MLVNNLKSQFDLSRTYHVIRPGTHTTLYLLIVKNLRNVLVVFLTLVGSSTSVVESFKLLIFIGSCKIVT